MTRLLSKLEPKVAQEELADRSDLVRKNLYAKVASDTTRGFLAVVAIILLITALVSIIYQNQQITEVVDRIDRNRNTTISSADKVADISVLAAYCAKLPEINTVAQIQQCIEVNLKEVKK